LLCGHCRGGGSSNSEKPESDDEADHRLGGEYNAAEPNEHEQSASSTAEEDTGLK